MLIVENDTDKKRCMSAYGDQEFILTKKEVLALLEGKVLPCVGVISDMEEK